MNSQTDRSLAKISWVDPTNNELRDFVLVEGATASIGRLPENDICIPERHVSRQHAVIAFQDGVFVIKDLGSANGTFMNDNPDRIAEPFPLMDGDKIRLYVPMLTFSATATAEDAEAARSTGRISIPSTHQQPPRLRVTAGPNEGAEFVLSHDIVTIGRAVNNATWDVALQDESVSRPHCRLQRTDNSWTVMDLGSANRTQHNNEWLTGVPRPIKDGDVLVLGKTTILFRQA